MNGRIIYKDIAADAEAEVVFTATGQTSFSSLDLHAADTPKYATLEPARWLLDGSFAIKPPPATVPFWSDEISDADGTFATPPTITCSFANRHTSTGITIEFEPESNEYCDSINVKWYRGASQIAEENFSPDAPSYICERTVSNFDKIVITLIKTSKPFRRARVNRITIGALRIFGGDELRTASCVNQMDILSSSLPASQLSFTLESKKAIDYVFTEKQPVEMRIGDDLVGTYYISSSERTALRTYKVTAFDAIGVLGDEDFPGGAYINGKNASEIVAEIIGGAFPVTVTAVNVKLYGVLLPQTKRAALQQVLFAWGAVAATDGSNAIRIFDLPSTPTAIGTDRTYTGVSVTKTAIVTQASVVSHSYAADPAGIIVIGNNRYTDTQTIYTVTNPDAIAAKENVKSVSAATLISSHNYAAVLSRMLNYYNRRIVHKSKILYNGERLGDCVAQPTPWQSTEVGNIERVNVIMSGVVAANVEARGNDT